MGRDLTVELSEDAYMGLERQARAAARSPAEFAAETLEERFGAPGRAHRHETRADEEDVREAARLRFERHFGTVNLGHATGVDNEAIDAELGRAYADDHKED